MEESWREVDSWPLYRVSSFGRVVSDHSGEAKELVLVCGRSGYPAVTLHKRGQRKQFLVHRLVLEVFIGPRPEGMECRHMDDDRTNNRLENLRWGSRAENIRDRYRNGRGNAGEAHPKAILTGETVRQIRRAYADGMRVIDIGNKLGISSSVACKVLARQSWKHVPDSPGVSVVLRPPSRLITAFGETKSLSEWSRDPRCSVSESSVHRRLANGWPAERAIAAAPTPGKVTA